MDLFKIECFVEDKRLAQVHRALSGLVYELQTTPVTNVTQTEDGALKAKSHTGSFGAVLKSLKLGQTFTSKEVRDRLVAEGYSDQRHHGVLHQLTKSGVIKRVGTGKYQLTQPNTKSKARRKA